MPRSVLHPFDTRRCRANVRPPRGAPVLARLRLAVNVHEVLRFSLPRHLCSIAKLHLEGITVGFGVGSATADTSFSPVDEPTTRRLGSAAADRAPMAALDIPESGISFGLSAIVLNCSSTNRLSEAHRHRTESRRRRTPHHLSSFLPRQNSRSSRNRSR